MFYKMAPQRNIKLMKVFPQARTVRPTSMSVPATPARMATALTWSTTTSATAMPPTLGETVS